MARQAGFRAALAEATGERDPIVIPGDYSESSGAEAARLLIAGRLQVDAIFCANDMMAVGCCGVLAEAGHRDRREVGVAGFDDIPIAHYVAPRADHDERRASPRWARPRPRQLIALMTAARRARARRSSCRRNSWSAHSTRRGRRTTPITTNHDREFQQGNAVMTFTTNRAAPRHDARGLGADHDRRRRRLRPWRR